MNGDEILDIKNKIIKATFIYRPNRFIAYVDIDGIETVVHVPNTGRCREILIPNCTVLLREGTNPLRKTKYDLFAAYKGNKLINIDSQIPNKVVEEALKNGAILPLNSFKKIQREKIFGNSRFDFKLENDDEFEYFLEVKGVTLENNGISSFPDAPTERGRKHLLELIEVKKALKGAGVLFLIQMDDINYFTPNDDMDKDFGEALRLAKENGVDIFAYNCKVGENFITLKDEVKIVM